MKILLIEDDDLKFELLERLLKSNGDLYKLQRACSYQSGVESLVGKAFDFVILDMSLPVSDLTLSPVNMDWLTFGGIYILRECFRRKIQTKIIIVSQFGTFVRDNEEISFDRLKEELSTGYGTLVVGCVYFNRAEDNWKSEILEYLTL